MPLDVFTQIAPEEYRQNMDDPHALMINRLKFELEQRRRQVVERGAPVTLSQLTMVVLDCGNGRKHSRRNAWP